MLQEGQKLFAPASSASATRTSAQHARAAASGAAGGSVGPSVGLDE